MKKALFYISIVFTSMILGVANVTAKDLVCDYHYYYNGNGLNQGSTAYDLWATCTFEFKESGDLSKHSCTMNYYYKSEDNEKTKNVKLDNWTATGNYKFVYSNSGKSVKESIAETKGCPKYLVAYYDVKSTLWFDSSSFQLYAAIDKSRAQEMLQNWADVGAISKVNILNSTSLPVDDDEQKKAYEQIEKWIADLEKATQSSFDFSECEDPSKVITRYSECKTIINNMETAITTIEKVFNGYVKNNIVDENDSRVTRLYKLIEDYKQKVKKVNANMDALDCETKVQLGLETDCGVVQPGDVIDVPGKDPEYNSSSRMCVSCGDGALTNLPEQLPMFIRNIILVLQLLTPVVLIGLGIYDFIKAVIASDEKVMKEAQNRFIRRIIAAVLIFLVVAIVKFAFSLIPNSTDVLSCIPCFISDSNSCSEPYICNRVELDANTGDITGSDDENSENTNNSSTTNSSTNNTNTSSSSNANGGTSNSSTNSTNTPSSSNTNSGTSNNNSSSNNSSTNNSHTSSSGNTYGGGGHSR